MFPGPRRVALNKCLLNELLEERMKLAQYSVPFPCPLEIRWGHGTSSGGLWMEMSCVASHQGTEKPVQSSTSLLMP